LHYIQIETVITDLLPTWYFLSHTSETKTGPLAYLTVALTATQVSFAAWF